MAYRLESPPFCVTIQIGLCEIGEDFQPVEGTAKVLKLHSALRVGQTRFAEGYHVEDPRLFIHNDDLYLSYTDGYQMAQAKINAQDLTASESFYIDKPFSGQTEKNWVFFSHEGKLMCVYNSCPHRIFEMSGASWKEVYKTSFKHDYKHGIIRGGTSPIRVGDNYLSFFHSSKDIKYKGFDGRQYYMGAYLFEAKAPFKPVAITTRPLIAGEIMDDMIPRLSNRIFVVFPSGVIRDGDGYKVSFGYNDYRCRYVSISDELLKQELKPIVYENELQHA